jgi:hypothetical protein
VTTRVDDADHAAEALGLDEDAAGDDLEKAFAASLRKGARPKTTTEGRKLRAAASAKPTADALWDAAKDYRLPRLKKLLTACEWTADELTAALRFATMWYHPKNVALLLAHGATDPTGEVLRVPTDKWCMQELWPVLGPPIGSDAARLVLHAAVTASTPSSEMLAYLLEQGIDVNASAPDGVTALHLVMTTGDYGGEMTKTLLRFGANREARTKTAEWEGCPVAGVTPLDVARRHGKSHLVALLTAP